MRRLLALLFLPFVAGMLTLPVRAGGSGKTASVRVQNRPAVSDAQLDAALRAKLAKSKIGKDGFRFRVQRGVVTWEGTTSVPQHKGAATRMARSSGALQVINNIKVGRKPGVPLRKAYVQP
jgi:osmotically-inducible protein OsmY